MAKYTVKEGEDLGTIARTFGLVSWKYLYEINKEEIGDNPDLLKAGTRLEIPQWDTTSGHEKIEEKGASAFAYTGGMRYRYPWVAFSVSLTDESENILPEFEEKRDFVVRDRQTGECIHSGETTGGAEIGLLLPDSGGYEFGIADADLLIDEEEHHYNADSEEDK